MKSLEVEAEEDMSKGDEAAAVQKELVEIVRMLELKLRALEEKNRLLEAEVRSLKGKKRLLEAENRSLKVNAEQDKERIKKLEEEKIMHEIKKVMHSDDQSSADTLFQSEIRCQTILSSHIKVEDLDRLLRDAQVTLDLNGFTPLETSSPEKSEFW